MQVLRLRALRFAQDDTSWGRVKKNTSGLSEKNTSCVGKERTSRKDIRRLVADLGQEALPVFLVAAIGFFEVFEDSLKVGVAF